MALEYVIERKPVKSVFIDLLSSTAMNRKEKAKEYNPRPVERVITFEIKYF